jgi:hypothetical protein
LTYTFVIVGVDPVDDAGGEHHLLAEDPRAGVDHVRLSHMRA